MRHRDRRLYQGFSELAEYLAVPVTSYFVPDGDGQPDGPLDDLECGEETNPREEGELLRRWQFHSPTCHMDSH